MESRTKKLLGSKTEFDSNGFSLVEVLLATALFAIIVTALIGAIAYAQESVAVSGHKPNAVLLAEEGMEAVRNMRDEDFSNLTDGTYGLNGSGEVWVLSEENDVTDDFYTRQIDISSVSSNIKQINVTVSWQKQYGGTAAVTLTSYLTNWMQYTASESWANPVLSSTLNVPGNWGANYVWGSGDNAYMVRLLGDPEFRVIDTSDTGNPVASGSTGAETLLMGLYVSGEYAYLSGSDNDAELQAVNLTDPTSPEVAGKYDASKTNDGAGLFVIENIVYLTRTNGSEELSSIDATDPGNMQGLDAISIPGRAFDVYVSRSYAYVVTSSNNAELVVVDISDPGSLEAVTEVDLSGNDNGMVIEGYGERIVVSRSGGGGDVTVVDISNPGSPEEVGSFSAGSWVRDLATDGENNLVFVGGDDNSAELQIWDISNPSSPSQIGIYDTDKDINGVYFDTEREIVYAVSDDGSGEFLIFEKGG